MQTEMVNYHTKISLKKKLNMKNLKFNMYVFSENACSFGLQGLVVHEMYERR